MATPAVKSVALITGGTTGIGIAAARVLREKGFVVLGTARRAAPWLQTALSTALESSLNRGFSLVAFDRP